MQPIEEPPLTPELIRARANALVARLRHAAEAAGRDPDGFRVVAVTKGFGLGVVRAAVEAGLAILGENRVQEAADKVAAVPGADWHLIGRLQSNKARQALSLFSTIHSVDSVKLLQRLDHIAAEERSPVRLLLQVNVSGEETKAGFPAAWMAAQAAGSGELAGSVRSLAAVEVTGLMTLAPLGATPEEQHRIFAALRQLREALREHIGVALPELSMGMSADADAAVAEGSTLVRVGTAIFGPRPGG